MGRSVSYPNNTKLKTYIDISYMTENEDDCEHEWVFFVEDLQQRLMSMFPSLENSDKWLGSEDKTILENDFCYIGVSEYCGLVCLWLVPKENNINLENNWINSIEKRFLSLGDLKKVGTFSNGEAVYEKVI